MRYRITNPASGASINTDGITLEAGETKEFEEREANLLLQRYGFLVLELEKNMFGAASEAISPVAAAKLDEQEEAKRLAEEVKYCPHCRQLLPEYQSQKKPRKTRKEKSEKPKKEETMSKHGKHRKKKKSR